MPLRPTPLTQGIALVRLMVQSGHSLGVTTLAERLGMPKSSVFRLLRSLVELGFVQKIEETKRYTVSADIFDFVHEIASHFGKNLKLDGHLRRAASRLKCSVYLSMLGSRDTYVICGAGDEANTTRLGSHGPTHASSAGKILVAQLPEREWRRFAPDPGERPATPYTNRDPEKFVAQIAQARATGVAWNIRESDREIVSLAAAVREPFLPRARLAVALVLRYDELRYRDQTELENAVLKLAASLERELGGR